MGHVIERCRMRYCAEHVHDAAPWLCASHESDLRKHFLGSHLTEWEAKNPGTLQTYVAATSGYLKVGFSRDVAKRLKALGRPGNDSHRPDALLNQRLEFETLAVFDGHSERAIQKRLKDFGHHVTGEWFTDNPHARALALA